MTRKRRGTARWRGSIEDGEGHVRTDSGLLDAAFDAASRFEDGSRTNPEELIGAAHAACYSMALADVLREAGYEPDNVRTDATVDLETDDQPRITTVSLETSGRADDIDEETFRELAEQAKRECPVSGALGNLEIEVEATLETPTVG